MVDMEKKTYRITHLWLDLLMLWKVTLGEKTKKMTQGSSAHLVLFVRHFSTFTEKNFFAQDYHFSYYNTTATHQMSTKLEN